jgi:hypothetical protein
LILARESDPGSNDGSSSLIDNCSTYASWQSLIGLLRTSGCFCSRCFNRAAFYYAMRSGGDWARTGKPQSKTLRLSQSNLPAPWNELREFPPNNFLHESYIVGYTSTIITPSEYHELELSTNLAENSMRPVTPGRKNWIHIGSSQAGPKVARFSRSWKAADRMRISVRDCDYLADLLIASGASSGQTQLRL